MSTTRLTDLAKVILNNASQLERYLNDNNLDTPTFDEHYPSELPLSSDMQPVRQKAVDAARDLQDLLIGPAMLLRPVLNATSLQAIYKYDVASKVPLDGEIPYGKLAEAVNLEEFDVRRIVRFASIHHHVFQEKRTGYVSHTAASRLLATDPQARAGLGFMFDECYQAFAHTVEALEIYKSPEPNQSGWAIGNKARMSMWEHHTQHPEKGERAALAMAAFAKGINHDTTALTRGYDWSALNAEKGIIVDLGGANGHAAVAVARENPDLRFVVQEIPDVVAKAKYDLSADVADRVEFLAHDFFQPQPTVAQAYLFRQVFHNWSDTHCINILRALIPALKPGVKIIVNDFIMVPPGILPSEQERGIRSMDMIMMSLFNSREREKQDWEVLFQSADPRFQNFKAWKPEGSQLGLVEVTWSGQ